MSYQAQLCFLASSSWYVLLLPYVYLQTRRDPYSSSTTSFAKRKRSLQSYTYHDLKLMSDNKIVKYQIGLQTRSLLNLKLIVESSHPKHCCHQQDLRPTFSIIHPRAVSIVALIHPSIFDLLSISCFILGLSFYLIILWPCIPSNQVSGFLKDSVS